MIPSFSPYDFYFYIHTNFGTLTYCERASHNIYYKWHNFAIARKKRGRMNVREGAKTDVIENERIMAKIRSNLYIIFSVLRTAATGDMKLCDPPRTSIEKKKRNAKYNIEM